MLDRGRRASCRSTPSWRGARPTAGRRPAGPRLRRRAGRRRSACCHDLERHGIPATWAVRRPPVPRPVLAGRRTAPPRDRPARLRLAGRRLVRRRPVLHALDERPSSTGRTWSRRVRACPVPQEIGLPLVRPRDGGRRPAAPAEAFGPTWPPARRCAGAGSAAVVRVPPQLDRPRGRAGRRRVHRLPGPGPGRRSPAARPGGPRRAAGRSTASGPWPARPCAPPATPAASGTSPRRSCSRPPPGGARLPVGAVGPGARSAGSARPPASARCSTSGSTPTTSPPTRAGRSPPSSGCAPRPPACGTPGRLDVLSMGDLAASLESWCGRRSWIVPVELPACPTGPPPPPGRQPRGGRRWAGSPARRAASPATSSTRADWRRGQVVAPVPHAGVQRLGQVAVVARVAGRAGPPRPPGPVVEHGRRRTSGRSPAHTARSAASGSATRSS